jgi:excisionase family DNA binding protein
MPTHFPERVHDGAESNQVATAGALPSPAKETPKPAEPPTHTERLAYSIQEAASLLGVNYFSVYRLVQRGKLKACRALRGKLLVPRSELLKLLKTE